MHKLVLITLFLAGTFSGMAKGRDEAKAFTELGPALAFIDREIDAKDWSGLTASLYPPYQAGQPNRTDWDELVKERGDRRLAVLLGGREFPTSKDRFVIGASPAASSPFRGWSRIRFIKAEGEWHLNAIYLVR